MQGRHLARRAVAYTIDAALACAALATPCIAIVLGMIVSPDPRQLSSPAVAMIIASFLLAVPLGFGYFLVRDGLRGGSMGKRVCGLRVVDARSGAPCRLVQSLVRNLILLAIGAADLLVPLFRADGRRIGDTVAGTIVVKKT